MPRYQYAFVTNQDGLDRIDAHDGENIRVSLDNQTAIVEFEPIVRCQPQTAPNELVGKLNTLDEALAIMRSEPDKWEVPDD